MHYPDYFSEGYEFSRWWYQGVPVWGDQIKEMLPKKNNRRFLEIGCYEGMSAIMAIENLLNDGDSIFLVDPFIGVSDEGESLQDVFRVFSDNISHAKQLYPERDIQTYRVSSQQALQQFITEGYEFDFIYVDGSHVTSTVEKDISLGWKILSDGGVMICDDYVWEMGVEEQEPYIAIEKFLTNTKDASVIFKNQQVGLQKI